MSRPLAVLLLIITTMLWGFAFVAQKSAMATMGPLTFSAVRYALGAIAIAPLVLWELRRTGKRLARADWPVVAIIAISFFLGVSLQQIGLTMTTVTNAGFLTSLYVLFVPLLALVVFAQKPHPIVWAGVPMALIGVFLLNGARFDGLNLGDLLVVCSAVAWAVQVYLIGTVSKRTGLPVTISVICFATTALLSAIGSAGFETPNLAAIGDGWIEILYAGLLSTAVAFTLQAVAQQYVPPANAAIILSAEGLFAALGGAVVLGERLPLIGYVGSALIFAAIVMVELVPALQQKKAAPVLVQ
ncbi:MAG: Permease of the drug/metabolite transporter superfamily [Devosia sp.]|uniref:DMT family transporter n=1 Tax=Devosia sp. TaxID=1871048 RepID=UPI002612F935|nr:DMT family transporter [Devosia sp.]MDB5541512.1 Permease of the drug/metabolite transporter superfamily [Devosia sp.]